MQLYDHIPTHGLWPIVWLDGGGLGRNVIQKNGDEKTWGRGMWIDLSEWARNMKLFVSYVNASLRVTSTEEDVKGEWIRYPILWIKVGLLLQLPPSSS